MMRQVVAAAALVSGISLAQWQPVDGGLLATQSPELPVRTLEIFAPDRGGGWFVVTDSGASRTALRFRFLSLYDLPVQTNDAGSLSWATRSLSATGVFTLSPGTRVEFEVGPGRTWKPPAGYVNGEYRALVLGPERAEIQIEGVCTGATATLPTLDCNTLRISVPQLETIVHAVVPAGIVGLVSTGADVLGFDFVRRVWSWNPVDGWSPLSAQKLEPLSSPASCWDGERRRLVLFGGDRAGVPEDGTWEWDGQSWLEQTPALRPPAQAGAAMAFDPLRHRSVLFGNTGDTWEWDGTSWQLISFPGGPSPRTSTALAWDGVRGEVLLFGGSNGVADTWSWNGQRWLQLTPASSPPPTAGGSLTWDETSQRVVLLGSAANSAWNGSTWSPLFGLQPQRAPLLAAMPDAGAVAVLSDNNPPQQLRGFSWENLQPASLIGPGARLNDGGVALLTLGRHREWREDHWAPVEPLPSGQRFLSVVPASGQLLAIAVNDAGVSSTWRHDDRGWTNTGERGVFGKIVVAQPDGTPWLFSSNIAFTWTSTSWAPQPWPTAVRLFDIEAAADGGFWAITDSALLHVNPPGEVTRLGDSRSLPFVAMGGRVPATINRRTQPGGVAEWLGPDAGWTVLTNFPTTPMTTVSSVANDGRGRAFLVESGSSGDSRTMVYDPWRVNGSRCQADSQCQSGACTDGRCCTSGCAAQCGVCSVERGAVEDGVCVAPSPETCHPAPMPEPPAGCGCASVDGAAVMLWLLLARRSRVGSRATARPAASS